MNKTVALLTILILAPLASAQENHNCAYFFWQQGCTHCARASPFLAQMEQKHPDVEIKRLSISNNKTNLDLLVNLYEAFNVSVSDWGVPTLFIDNKVFIGDVTIINNLEDEIVRCEQQGCICPTQLIQGNVSAVAGESTGFGHVKNLQLTLPVIVGAALVDAINPCAFAVLIILLTTLLAAGKKGNVLPTGIAYISAIYLAYLLMGLGLFTAIQASGLSWLAYRLVGVLAIIVGLLNIKDYVKYGAGGFVMEVPMSWRPRLKKLIHGVTSVPGAFATGLLVSLFLLPCTSGPYIVVLGLLADTATRNAALPILLLYNAIFVLPMFLILGMVKWGLTTTEKAEKWRNEKIRYLHLVAGVLILLMGVVITLGIV